MRNDNSYTLAALAHWHWHRDPPPCTMNAAALRLLAVLAAVTLTGASQDVRAGPGDHGRASNFWTKHQAMDCGYCDVPKQYANHGLCTNQTVVRCKAICQETLGCAGEPHATRIPCFAMPPPPAPPARSPATRVLTQTTHAPQASTHTACSRRTRVRSTSRRAQAWTSTP